MLFSPFLETILSVRLSVKRWGLEYLLFYEFINILSIFIYYTFADLIMLLYTFLIISFD